MRLLDDAEVISLIIPQSQLIDAEADVEAEETPDYLQADEATPELPDPVADDPDADMEQVDINDL